MSSCETTRSPSPVSCSQSDRGRGGDGDRVFMVPSNAAWEPSCHNEYPKSPPSCASQTWRSRCMAEGGGLKEPAHIVEH
eukprot:12931210-Prorocentrum_lima.AAC.1